MLESEKAYNDKLQQNSNQEKFFEKQFTQNVDLVIKNELDTNQR